LGGARLLDQFVEIDFVGRFWWKQTVSNSSLIKVLYSFDKLFIESDGKSVKHHY
jgi:hypothetical protein